MLVVVVVVVVVAAAAAAVLELLGLDEYMFCSSLRSRAFD
jgi:hypothetical protein